MSEMPEYLRDVTLGRLRRLEQAHRRRDEPDYPAGVREPDPDDPDVLGGAGAAAIAAETVTSPANEEAPAGVNTTEGL